VQKIRLPRMGQTMQQATLLSWYKKEGDPFTVGETLYEIETEKSVITVEAKFSGTLVRITAPEGEELPVGALLAIVANPGETLSPTEIEAAITEEQHPVPLAAPATVPAASEQTAPVIVPSTEPGPGSSERMRVMPRARMLAEQLGVNLAIVQGSGANGSITVEDVQRAAQATAGPRIRERRPLNRITRTMAEVVTQSWQQVPQFVQMVLVDASSLARRREAEGKAIQQSHDLKLSYNDLILEAIIRSIEEIREVNASFAGDAIVLYEDINVSVAVATDAGLLVPVVHQAQKLSLGDLALRLREISQRARAGSLTPADFEGGTITVSNLGMSGVETGTPLVTRPQAAIVFIGTILNRPVAIDESLEVRPTFYVSIGYDHRVVDGATAAKFTGTVKRKLEAS
jgi:pyruvate dehydrogenase E2 component (dihydrolipoamide acetyltransferase)